MPGRLADFRLGELLGGNLTVTVQRAVHLATGRERALKVLRREALRDPEEIHRFDLECEILAQIEHPHVVPLYDAWRDNDCAWIATRLLRCGTVADALTGEPWPIAEIVVLIDQVAAALDAVHRAGVVHGDVAAGNVMFDEARRVYLLGFGSAARFGADVHVAGAVDVAGLVRLAASCLVGQVLAADADPVESVCSIRYNVQSDVVQALALDPTQTQARGFADALRSATTGRGRPSVASRNPLGSLVAFVAAIVDGFEHRRWALLWLPLALLPALLVIVVLIEVLWIE